MAKKSKQLSGPELKRFRHDIAVLNRKGLIPGKAVSARTARPLQKRGGEDLRKIVSKYRSVLDGTAVAVKPPTKKALREQHALGHKTVRKSGGRVLVPVGPTEKVKLDKGAPGGVRIIEKRSGAERIEIPRERGETIEQWAERAGALRDERRDSYIGYEFYGHKSDKFYSGPNAINNMLADILSKYRAKYTGDPKDFFRHFVIVSFEKRTQWNK